MSQEQFETLVQFFKVLGNHTRLRIVGMLANRDMSVGELAQALDLKEPTISEHLNTLKTLDMVTVRAEGNFRVYSFNPKALHVMSKDVFTRENLAELVPAPADDAAKALRNILDGERVKHIPASRRNLLYLLGWLAEKFEHDRRYSEKEVNAILNQHHEDHATLRRDLVAFRFMTREKSIYWRLPTPDTEQWLGGGKDAE